MKRLLLALLVAPLLPTVVHAMMGESEYQPLALFAVVGIAIYGLQVVAGIPGYLFLRRAGQHGLRAYALFGFCVGAAPLLALWLYLGPDYGVARGLLGSAYRGLLGAMTAATFWFVARPDRRVGSARPAST